MYVIYTFYSEYDQHMNKTHVEGMQNICLFPYCYLFKLKIVVKRNMIIMYEKYPTSSNWYLLMNFTDFQWLFQAKCNFSRPTSNSMTFPGLNEPWIKGKSDTESVYKCFPRQVAHISRFSVLSYCESLRYMWNNKKTTTKTAKKLLFFMPNLQSYYHFKLDF